MDIFEMLFAFLIGGTLYLLIELAWRRKTHISMFFAGGFAFMLMHGIFVRYDIPIIQKSLAGGLIITCVEFCAGYILNIKMRLAVWDYSARRFNVYGQICPLYSFLWTLLSVFACVLSSIIWSLFN